MKKTFLFLAFICFTFTAKAQEKINWLSFEDAIALNRVTPKPILIDVYTDWCGYCKKLDIETYSNQKIAAYVNANFYPIKLDGEEKKDIIYNDYTFKFEGEGRRGYHQLPASLMNGEMSYPTTIFLTEKEELIQKVPGFLDKKAMEKILVYFAQEMYKTTKWEDFEETFESNL